jgi:hypothetical protein
MTSFGDGTARDKDGDTDREHEWNDVNTGLFGRVMSTGLIEEGELVCPTKHGAHEEKHESGSAELGSVFQDRERNEGFGVDVPFPEEKSRYEETTEDEKEDDSPV